MFDVLLILTAVIIAMAVLAGYRRGDGLVPMVIFAPMLFYTYVYSPAALLYSGELEEFLLSSDQLEYVALINLLGVVLFCIGCVSRPRFVGDAESGSILQQIAFDDRTRKRLVRMACVLGALAFVGFAYMVQRGGGFIEVFSRPKPFLSSPSGFVGESPMLAYPALLLLAMTLRGRVIGGSHLVLALFFASPT